MKILKIGAVLAAFIPLISNAALARLKPGIQQPNRDMMADGISYELPFNNHGTNYKLPQHLANYPELPQQNNNNRTPSHFTLTKHGDTVGTDMNDLLREVYKQHQLTTVDVIHRMSANQERNTLCLALSIYHEARSSSLNDKISVAFVGLNRLNANGVFGNSLCEVINQRLPNTTIPQYSWLAFKLENLVPRENQAWIESQTIAYHTMMFSPTDPSHGAKFFWNPDKSRSQPWMNTGKEYYKIGAHIFMVALH